MPGIEISTNGDEMENHISVTDIADLLLHQYVIVTGLFSFWPSPWITTTSVVLRAPFFDILIFFQAENPKNDVRLLHFQTMVYFIYSVMKTINDWFPTSLSCLREYLCHKISNFIRFKPVEIHFIRKYELFNKIILSLYDCTP